MRFWDEKSYFFAEITSIYPACTRLGAEFRGGNITTESLALQSGGQCENHEAVQLPLYL